MKNLYFIFQRHQEFNEGDKLDANNTQTYTIAVEQNENRSKQKHGLIINVRIFVSLYFHWI